MTKKKGNDFSSLPFFLLDFDFLFHVNLFTLRISKLVLKEGETLIGDYLDAESVFHLSLALHGNEALGKLDVRMQEEQHHVIQETKPLLRLFLWVNIVIFVSKYHADYEVISRKQYIGQESGNQGDWLL